MPPLFFLVHATISLEARLRAFHSNEREGDECVSAERMLINLTRGPEDPDRVTVAFVMANAAVSLDKKTVVLLSTEGVRALEQRVVDTIAERGFAPLKDLVQNFLEAGGEIWACTPCVAKRGLEGRLLPAVKAVGAVTAIEFVAQDGVSLSF